MEQLDYSTLNNEQKEFVHKYKKIHDRLKELQDGMDSIQTETKDLLNQLGELRKKENNIFNNG